MSNAEQSGQETRSCGEQSKPKATSWIGVVLMVTGAVLLLQNLGGIAIDNWWAMFMLIPAAGSFAGWTGVRCGPSPSLPAV